MFSMQKSFLSLFDKLSYIYAHRAAAFTAILPPSPPPPPQLTVKPSIYICLAERSGGWCNQKKKMIFCPHTFHS